MERTKKNLLEKNQRFKDYIIQEMLGVGAFGEVYVAENEFSGELHAIKSLYD